MTLLDYYLESFCPHHQFQGPRETRKHLAAVQAFEEFAPDLPIGDITHKRLREFETLAYEQFGVTGATRRVSMLQRILNHYHGSRKFARDRREPPAWGRVADSELWQFFLTAYKPRRLPNAAASTVNQYRTNIGRLSALVGHPATLADLTDDNVSEIMTQLVTEGRSPTTANGVRAKFMALARYASSRGLLKVVPDVQKLSQYRRLPTSWTADEFDRLLSSCMQQRGSVDEIPAKFWWHAIHLVLFDTAARLGAVLSIKQADVDLAKGTVYVLAEHQKHRADQLWHLHAQTLDALRRIWLPERTLLFPWPWCEATLFGHYKKVLQRADLPADRKHKFHTIRRTHATMLAGIAGLGAASLSLGHSSGDVTREHYIDPTHMAGPVALLPRPAEQTASAPEARAPRIPCSVCGKRMTVKGSRTTCSDRCREQAYRGKGTEGYQERLARLKAKRKEVPDGK